MNLKGLSEKAQGSVSAEDKAALKAGAGTCWTKFVKFTDKFTEMIFGK